MVISVLIMSIMGVIVFALSTSVIQQIDFSQNIDNATLAYYGAESSMEQALYDARKLNIIHLQDSGEFSNNVTWKRTIDPTQEFMQFKKIPKNTFVQVDLFDADDPSCSSVETTRIACDWESMNLEWEGDGTVELTITSWVADSVIDYNPEQYTEVRYISATTPWILNDLESGKNYRLKIKSLLDDISLVTLTLYAEDNAIGDIVSIPNFLTIYGEGSYRHNKQALTVKIPRKVPLSSLYDYVIFSEDDIVKEL